MNVSTLRGAIGDLHDPIGKVIAAARAAGRRSQSVGLSRYVLALLPELIGCAGSPSAGSSLRTGASSCAGGAWRTATLNVGPIQLLLGPVFGALLDFLIVALVVFYLSKLILREQAVTKK